MSLQYTTDLLSHAILFSLKDILSFTIPQLFKNIPLLLHPQFFNRTKNTVSSSTGQIFFKFPFSLRKKEKLMSRLLPSFPIIPDWFHSRLVVPLGLPFTSIPWMCFLLHCVALDPCSGGCIFHFACQLALVKHISYSGFVFLFEVNLHYSLYWQAKYWIMNWESFSSFEGTVPLSSNFTHYNWEVSCPLILDSYPVISFYNMWTFLWKFWNNISSRNIY